MWLDWYFRFHHKLTVGFKHYAPKTYRDDDYTTDEILKKCKEAYGRGYLTEDLKWTYKNIANNICDNLQNLYDDEDIIQYNEVSIIDDWDSGCDIEATYYDENDLEVAWLVVRVYGDQEAITFRQIDVFSQDTYALDYVVSLRGKGFTTDPRGATGNWT